MFCIISVESEVSSGAVVGGGFGLYLDCIFICSFQPTAELKRHGAPEKYLCITAIVAMANNTF